MCFCAAQGMRTIGIPTWALTLYLVEKLICLDQCVCDVFRSVILKKPEPACCCIKM